MMEYDFLRSIGDLVRSLKEFPLPVMVADLEFQVYWSNAPMYSFFTGLGTTQGLLAALAEFDLDKLRADLRERGGCTLQDVLPLSGVGMNFSPVWRASELVGVLIVLIGADSMLDVRDLHQTASTASSLSAGIRRSMGDMFGLMDTAAHKAEVMNADWIKPNFERIALLGYRLLRITDNIAEYASYQNGTLEVRPQGVDLELLLEEISGAVAAMAPAAEIPVRFLTAGPLGGARIDPSKFELILFNLLHNALYFTRPGNRVEVSAERQDKWQVVTIRDWGVGIPPQILPHVFKPYTTYNPTGMQPTTGLGLTLVRILMNAHGGTVEVDSRVEEGTVVTLRFLENNFSHPLVFGQGSGAGRLRDRFSKAYVGLSDVAISPYRQRALGEGG